jgi:hypothetical protein
MHYCTKDNDMITYNIQASARALSTMGVAQHYDFNIDVVRFEPGLQKFTPHMMYFHIFLHMCGQSHGFHCFTLSVITILQFNALIPGFVDL